ncbi:hypothetical protein ACH5RR_000655 [Cinchona calisaya]|uniref:DC1 domain-containing protein n=1 Tax=Cinchona calisaya TaxID=153742 RepID=A0ABD3B2B9_9GENT
MSSQAEATINHFSHPHPLQLSNNQNHITSSSCSGCKLKATGLIYSCSTCNYFLHVKCSKMPKQITHPFDRDHVFSLLTKPIYPGGVFTCDACGKPGEGFCYHCKICNIDLHILCAAMPLNLTHQSHCHQLKLIFSHTNVYNCDICYTPGSNNHWLYRCHICDFDVHLNCSNIPVRQPTFQAPPQFRPNYQPFNPQFAAATGIPVPNFTPTVNPLNQGIHQQPVMPFQPRQNNDYLLILQKLQALHPQHLQSLMAGGGVGGGVGGIGSGVGGIGGVGGVGGGGDLGGMQQLIQAVSGIGNGAMGGGGQNILQALLGGGGGGGGLNVLQGLIGGGGNGLDLSMLNGLDLGGLFGAFNF